MKHPPLPVMAVLLAAPSMMVGVLVGHLLQPEAPPPVDCACGPVFRAPRRVAILMGDLHIVCDDSGCSAMEYVSEVRRVIP